MDETLACLTKLRDVYTAVPNNSGIRFFLDSILMKRHYGLPIVGQMNYAMNPHRRRIPCTTAVLELENPANNLKVKQISALITLEHITPMADLRKMLFDGNFETLIKSYQIAFVTKKEDKKLSATGLTGLERYAASGITIHPRH